MCQPVVDSEIFANHALRKELIAYFGMFGHPKAQRYRKDQVGGIWICLQTKTRGKCHQISNRISVEMTQAARNVLIPKMFPPVMQ